jgi:Mrp family chromosome partitioning ATPase
MTTNSPRPTIGVVENPDLAAALQLLGFDVVGGGNFRDAALAVRNHGESGSIPVIISNVSRPGLRAWAEREVVSGSRLIVLRTEPAGPVLESTGISVDLPATVNQILAAAGWGASGHPLGENQMTANGAIAEVATYLPKAPVAPAAPVLPAAPVFVVQPAPVYVPPATPAAPVVEAADEDQDIPDWAREVTGLPPLAEPAAVATPAVEPVAPVFVPVAPQPEPDYPAALVPAFEQPVAIDVPAVAEPAPQVPIVVAPVYVAPVAPVYVAPVAPVYAEPEAEFSFDDLVAEAARDNLGSPVAFTPTAPDTAVAEEIPFDDLVAAARRDNLSPAAPVPSVFETPAPRHEAPAAVVPTEIPAPQSAYVEPVFFDEPTVAPAFDLPFFDAAPEPAAPALEAPVFEAPAVAPQPAAPAFEAPAPMVAPVYEAPVPVAAPVFQAPAPVVAPVYQAPAPIVTPAYQAPVVAPVYQAPPLAPVYEAPFAVPAAVPVPDFGFPQFADAAPAQYVPAVAAPSYQAPAVVAPAYQAPAVVADEPGDYFADMDAMFDRRMAATPPVTAGYGQEVDPSILNGITATVVISNAGKGGVGKTASALALAQRASQAGMRVALVDMNRGQGDVRKYLRLDSPSLPSIYNAAISGRSEDALLTPEQVTGARHPKLSKILFAVVLAPPPELANPEQVTATVYAQVIGMLGKKVDLVIVDTQITESVDTSGLIDHLVIPALINGAWGYGITDMSKPGLDNLLARTKDFVTRGVSRDRLLLTVNKAAGFDPADQQAIQKLFSPYATFIGAAGDDIGFANSMNLGEIDAANPTIAPVIDAALFRITGRSEFAPRKAGRGIFGRRR